MTLDDLEHVLLAVPEDKPVVFSTDEGDVPGGYHLTELKHARVTSLDCAAQTEVWTELHVQLLDGSGGAHMTAGRLRAILEKSVAHLPEASMAEILIEYAPGNKGLRLFELGLSKGPQDARLVMRLNERHAVCKPAAAFEPKAALRRPEAHGSRCCG